MTAATVVRLFSVPVASASVLPMMIFVVEFLHGGIGRYPSDWLPFVVAVVLLLGLAAVLWTLAPWASRLMIRVPKCSVCPNCRYKLESLASPQCLECGYTLTREFLTTREERETETREPDTIWLRQIATLAMRLATGAFLPVGVIGSFMTAVAAIEEPRWNEWTTVYAWLFVTAVAAVVLVFASWLSPLFVPGRRRFERRQSPDE